MEKKNKNALTIVCLLLFSILADSNAQQEDFDVRNYLSTVSRYGVVKNVANSTFEPSDVPNGCTPIHLNLVARHGTRAPTKKRMRDLDRLAAHLKELVRDAKEQGLSLEEIPAWLQGWESPWKDKVKGGELIIKGEEELYDFGVRTREKFASLFNESYHPDIYTIKATQIPRASASAVAYGMGLFSGTGTLGPGRKRAFAVVSESRASDTMLRFHDCCQNYKDFRKSQEPSVDKLKEPIFDEITHSLIGRYKLNFTRQDASSLWFLCKQEASLLDITDQACGLFSPSEVAMLEWTDDLEAFILKGYGNSINYRMGVPLLKDILQSMEQAIRAKEENHVPGSYEKARLRFAHAETVIPFSCLLGLFLEESEFQQILREQPLQLPPKPPQKRNWKASVVAPFAGNNMLVLYSCPAFNNYYVQVLHNEQPIPVPGCDGSEFCSFETFKERIVAPHLKHEYADVCTVKLDKEKSNSDMNRPARPTLNAHKKGVAEILGSLPVQDRDWRLLCTTAKLREHKLIPENASLQREPVYKEPSERQQERIDKRLSKQTPRETSDMTFLKSAPVLKIKQKGGTPASSPVVAQKRKSDVMTSLAADSSKKLAKTTQDKGKKVVIDSPVRPRDFLAMQEKLLAEIPYEELVSRSTELAAQSVALFMKAVATPSKETDSLKRQNAHFQENIKRLKQEVAKMEELHKELEEANRAKEQLELELKKSQDTIAEMARDLEAERESGKKQYDQAVSDYIYTTLSKVPDFDFSLLGDEAAEMAEAFRSMSPTRTQGNLPDEIEGAQAEEVENEVVSKIVDEAAPDETTPAA